MPPRHGKSLLASTLFPAWYLGRNPSKRVILASYTIDLAQSFSRQIRNTIGYDGLFQIIHPGVRLAGDSAAASQWGLAGQLGGLKAAGVGGGITGYGAHLLLVDDPVKDAQEADSPTVQARNWNWWATTAFTRLMPEGAAILTATRWHKEDLTGKVLKQAEKEHGADAWTVLHLPAIREVEGQEYALWPDAKVGYPLPVLKAIKANVGQRAWQALYQGSPTDDEGAVFKLAWMNNRYRPDALPQFTHKIQVGDTAFKTGPRNDYSVIATWATDGVNFYLLDIWRAKVEIPELKRAFIDQHAKHRPDLVLVEDKASGQPIIQELRRETALPVIPSDKLSQVSKHIRAEAVSPLFEAGKIWLPESAEWLADWIIEHTDFPTGSNDDQVDTTAYALDWLKERALGVQYMPGIFDLTPPDPDENDW